MAASSTPVRSYLPLSQATCALEFIYVRCQQPVHDTHLDRVETGLFEDGEISLYYDSMIAKLICHGATRDQAIVRMRDALNAFVIRGIDSNIPFQAALMQNPRFLSGVFTTAFLAEEYPDGCVASDVVHDDPGLLAAVGAFGRRRYIDRAVQVSGQMAGHQRKVGSCLLYTSRCV